VIYRGLNLKNIFIEGIQGAGKSTLLNELHKNIPEYKVYREGDLSPVNLAFCSYMTTEQYMQIHHKYTEISKDLDDNTLTEGDLKITAYTQILTDIEGFHKYMEHFEIYNGNIDFNRFKEIIFKRYSNFYSNGNIFECSLFQNNIETMILFYKMSDDEIMEFYSEAFYILKDKEFKLLYLDVIDIESTIDRVKRERTDTRGEEIWYTLMIQYIENSPYGKMQHLKGFEGLVSHLQRRRNLELKVISSIVGKDALILDSENYDINKIMV